MSQATCDMLRTGRIRQLQEAERCFIQSAQTKNNTLLLALQALKRNPYAPHVPCHRVIASTLELGGFKGDWVSLPQL